MCFVWISEQTVTLACTTLTNLLYITEVEGVTARYGLSPYRKQKCFMFKGLKQIFQPPHVSVHILQILMF
jgi:hypothetical protein